MILDQQDSKSALKEKTDLSDYVGHDAQMRHCND
jgi:hypothetical protein